MIEFAGVSIDRDGHELRRNGETVKVEPQVFDVLVYLIEHRDRLVSKLELYDAVWGHRFVTESALTSRIKTARQVIGDTGRDQRMIRTVHGKGYRFVAELTGPSAASGAQKTGAAPAAAIVDALVSGRGAAVRVDLFGGGAAYLRDLRALAVRNGIPTGHGSTHRASLRTYGCLIDAVDEVVGRCPELLDALPARCRAELEQVLGGALPSRRQRWALAVHELVVTCTERLGGLLLVLEGLEHADDDTLAAVQHLGDLTGHHPLVVAVGAGGELGTLRRFVRQELPVPEGDEDRTVTLPADAAEALDLAALLEAPFDLETLATALAVPTQTCLRVLDICERAGALRDANGRYTLDLDRLPLHLETRAHRRGADHRLLADRLLGAGGDPARIAHHCIEAGDARQAIPFVLLTAAARAAAGLHREALRWVDLVLSEASGAQLGELHALRADALGALGDPAAATAYRQAIGFAGPEQLPTLRARLARAALWSGDLEMAEDVLRGLEPSGGPGDADLLLVSGMLAYFKGDLDSAEKAAESAGALALAPGASSRLLDAITLQGMIAHSRGRWSDRLLRELRSHRNVPEIATTVFDCHLCVAEYLLYGPTPYDEVVAMADRLREQAETLDAPRGVAFALCVAGEAELLGGNLDAAADLLSQSVELHRDLGGDTGLAHSLQRLAEVRLATGERATAEQLARDALGRARWSPLSHHLLQRVYGTLVRAATDEAGALVVVDEAAQVLDESDNCHFCEVMFAVPAAIACAQGGRMEDAERYLHAAAQSAALWQGTAWQGAVAEARASLAATRGDVEEADELLRQAALSFERAGQTLDAVRCRESLTSGP